MNIKETRYKRKLIIIVIIMITISTFATTGIASAYKLSGSSWYYTMPKNIHVLIPSNYIKYKDDINTWANKTGKVKFYWGSNGANKMTIMDNTKVDNGTYAVTYLHSKNFKTIITYKSFFKTTQIRKNETIVHEVGHALGLDHIPAAQKQNTSVMRAKGFNGKAYPLADDINGIKKIYK